MPKHVGVRRLYYHTHICVYIVSAFGSYTKRKY